MALRATISAVASNPHVGAGPALIKSLDSLEHAHNYRRWILELAEKAICGRVLEVGAGSGTFTADVAPTAEVVAVEPDQVFLPLLYAVAEHAGNVRVIAGTLDDVDVDERFDGALMINVLEHIEDDAAAVRQVYELLRPGAHLFVWVPAFQLLMSDFDRSIGHHRRYRLQPLRTLLADTGFEVLDARYVNMPGWFSWLLVARCLRHHPTGGALVNAFDRRIVPLVRAVERHVRMPFGQSVMIVARRPDEPQ